MADSNRRSTLAAILLPLLFLAMSGFARAATLTVSSLADSGPNTLRAAMIAHASGDTINFSVTGTITLLSTLPTITDTLTITGPSGSPGITISGGGTVQLMEVHSGATLNLQLLTMVNGSTTAIGTAQGGAITSNGTLTVTDCTFSGNQATGSFGSGQGGAIKNAGTLTITNSTFSANQATGEGGTGQGGAIYVSGGTVTITNSTFSGNQATFGPPEGGAIFNDGAIVNLKSTILAASVPDNCGGNTFTDNSFNISDDGSCGFGGSSVNNSATLFLDPAGLQSNGGPTDTIALESDSSAIGFDTDCTDQELTPQPVLTDQRHYGRPNSPAFCDSGAYQFDGVGPFTLDTTGERVQIARSPNPHSDQVNMAFTFTENAFPTCDAGDNAFNGIDVVLRKGSCGALDDAALELFMNSWVVHTVNHQSYGTLFISQPPATLSARMVELPKPPAPACGEWTLNIEVTGIYSSSLGDGPFALVLSNPDGDQECFDITNAIVGNQIDPPTRTVRRGVRR